LLKINKLSFSLAGGSLFFRGEGNPGF